MEEQPITKKMLTEALETQTKAIFARIDKTDATLAPIAAIYDSTKGFTSVARWMFKSLIIPLSVIIGVVLTFKKIFNPY